MADSCDRAAMAKYCYSCAVEDCDGLVLDCPILLRAIRPAVNAEQTDAISLVVHESLEGD